MAFRVTGITRDKTTGEVLGSCDVYLLKYASGSDTFTQIDASVSDLLTGEYSLTASDSDPAYCVVSFNEAVSPVVAGVTARTLTPSEVTVSNQTADFGALTLASAGGFKPVDANGDEVNLTAVTDQTGATRTWSISSGRLIANGTPDVDDTVVITCSHAGGSVALTINSEASTYSVADATDFEAAVDAIGTASGGAITVKMRVGDYQWPQAAASGAWLRDRGFTNTVTITSHNTSNRARFLTTQPGFAASRTEYRVPTNTTFDAVKFHAVYERGTSPYNGTLTDKGLTLIGTVTALVFNDCDFTANLTDLGFGTCFLGGLLSYDGTTTFSGTGLTIQGCRFSNAECLIELRGLNSSGLTIKESEFYDFGSDCIKIARVNDVILRDLDMHSPYADPDDTNHGDFVQLVDDSGTNQDVSDWIIERIRMNAARDDATVVKREYQGIFLKPLANFHCTGFQINDIVHYAHTLHGVTLYNGQNCMIERVSAVHDPAWFDVGNPPSGIQIDENGASVTTTGNTIRDCVARTISSIEGTDTLTNNVTANSQTTGNADSYDSLFDGPSFAADTIAEIMTAFAIKTGGALDATIKVGGIGPYVDYDANTSSPPRSSGPTLVQATTYTDQTYDTNQNLVLPSGIASGSTLVAVMRTGELETVTAASGWTLVGSNTSDTGIYVYERTADGTEGGTTATWTTGTNSHSCFAFYEVDAPSGQVEADFAGASLDPPSHSPTGGDAATVWCAVTSVRRNDNDVTASPSGYTDNTPRKVESSVTNSTNGAEVTLAAAYKESSAATEDPGVFTWTGTVSGGPMAATVSVR